jgi:hypothetical protein
MASRLQQSAWCVAGVAALLAVPLGPAAGQAPGPPQLDSSTLDRVTRYVEDYYTRAQSLMVEETVTLHHLRTDLSPDGLPRRLVYELRVDWAPATDTEEARATVVRQLIRVGNRAPRENEKPECLDPRSVSPEPLAFLLRDKRNKFRFRSMGRTRLDGRNALLLDYLPSAEGKPEVSGDKTCLQMDLPGRSRGRVWVDSVNDAILRVDEFLVGPTDVRVPRALQTGSGWGLFVTVDRSDTTTRYQPVVFDDPPEQLMLPSRIESVSVIRANGIQRLRMTQEFRNYRRFLTASRILQ